MSRILFVEHTAGHNPHKTYDKPTGGTLTSLTFVTEYLASVGHEVYVQSSHLKEETVNGVRYILGEANIKKWDVIVFGRNILPKDFVLYNKQNDIKIIWWLHDIVDTRYLQDDAFKYVDHVVALSDYCKRTYSDFYEIPEDHFTVIPNGIDPKVFYPGKYEDRNINLVITASALIKGFLPLEIAHLNLYRGNPNLDFRIYSNQSLHGLKNNAGQDQFLDKMRASGVHVYNPVNPDVLAHIMRKAWCLLMPNSYPEICSNLLLQARACGLPVVTSDIGANPEFVTDGVTGSMTTKWKPHDIHSWIVEFANKTLDVCGKPALHRTISENAPKGVQTWGEIGNAWNKLLEVVTRKDSSLAKV